MKKITQQPEVEILKKINERQYLIRRLGKKYVVSQTMEDIHNPEIVILPADENGDITSWLEVAGETNTNIISFMQRLIEGDIIFFTEE